MRGTWPAAPATRQARHGALTMLTDRWLPMNTTVIGLHATFTFGLGGQVVKSRR